MTNKTNHQCHPTQNSQAIPSSRCQAIPSSRRQASPSSRCHLIWIRCTSSLHLSFLCPLTWVCHLCTRQGCSLFMVGSLLLTCTSTTSSHRFPSMSGYPGRLMNSWWACFRPTLWWLKTLSSWRISWKTKKMNLKYSKQRRKTRRKLLTQRLSMLRES